MDTNKEDFLVSINKYGIVGIRAEEIDTIEILAGDGTIFHVSTEQYGQGPGENGLWIDKNQFPEEHWKILRDLILALHTKNLDAWLDHNTAMHSFNKVVGRKK